jgi:hypothetical protein
VGIIRARRIPGPVRKNKRRRCLHCRQLFHRHPRTRTQQKYCSAPTCRAASKKASQQRRLRKPENQDYFYGAPHVNRVQAWREKHPEYGREPRLNTDPLQEMIIAQLVEGNKKTAGLALQEMIESEVCESGEEIGV